MYLWLLRAQTLEKANLKLTLVCKIVTNPKKKFFQKKYDHTICKNIQIIQTDEAVQELS